MTSPRAQPFNDLPQSFRREQQELVRAGITTWPEVQAIDELQLSRLARSGLASARNLTSQANLRAIKLGGGDTA